MQPRLGRGAPDRPVRPATRVGFRDNFRVEPRAKRLKLLKSRLALWFGLLHPLGSVGTKVCVKHGDFGL